MNQTTTMNYISKLPPELQTMIAAELPLKANRRALLEAYPDLGPAIDRVKFPDGTEAEYDLMLHRRIGSTDHEGALQHRNWFLQNRRAEIDDLVLTADDRSKSPPCCAAGIKASWHIKEMFPEHYDFQSFADSLACDMEIDRERARKQGKRPHWMRLHMLEAQQYEPKSLKCRSHSPSQALQAQVYQPLVWLNLEDEGGGSLTAFDEFWFVDGGSYKFMPATQLLPLVRYLDALRLCSMRFHADVRWSREYLYGWQAEILTLLGRLPIYLNYRQITTHLSRPSLRDERVLPRPHTNLLTRSSFDDEPYYYKNDYGTTIPVGSATHALRTLSAFRYLTILHLTGGVTVHTDLFTARVMLATPTEEDYDEDHEERAGFHGRVLDGSVPMMPETGAFPALRVFVLGFAAETGGGGWYFVGDGEEDEEEPGDDGLGGDAVAEGKEGDNSDKPIGELDGADEGDADHVEDTAEEKEEEDDDGESLDLTTLPAAEREALAKLDPEPVYRFRTRPNGRTVNKLMLGAAQAVRACMPRLEHFELKLEDNFDEDGEGVAAFVKGDGPRKRKLRVIYDVEVKVVAWELGYYAKTWRPANEVVKAWGMVGEDVKVVFRH